MIALATFLAAAAAAHVPSVRTVRLAGDVARVRDAAATDIGGDLVLLKLRRTRAAITLAPADLLTLIANRVPGARFTLRSAGPVRFVRGAPQVSRGVGSRRCSRARTDIPAGAAVTTELLQEASCASGADMRALRYDLAAHAAYARRAVPAGTDLARIRTPAAPPVIPGQSLVLRSVIGPVIVERQVYALQAGRAGGRIFARTDDGIAVTARYPGQEGGTGR